MSVISITSPPGLALLRTHATRKPLSSGTDPLARIRPINIDPHASSRGRTLTHSLRLPDSIRPLPAHAHCFKPSLPGHPYRDRRCCLPGSDPSHAHTNHYTTVDVRLGRQPAAAVAASSSHELSGLPAPGVLFNSTRPRDGSDTISVIDAVDATVLVVKPSPCRHCRRHPLLLLLPWTDPNLHLHHGPHDSPIPPPDAAS